MTFDDTDHISCPILMGVRAYYMEQYMNGSNPGIDVVTVLSFQQVVLFYSLTSSTIPALNGFLKGFSTSMGMDFGYTQASSGQDSNGYSLSRLRNTGRAPSGQDNLRTDKSQYIADIQHSQTLRRDSSIGSRVSQHPIIRKDVEYNIAYEANGTRQYPL